jgi:hypothetical protein
MDQRDEKQTHRGSRLENMATDLARILLNLIRAGSREPAAFPEPAGEGLEVLT